VRAAFSSGEFLRYSECLHHFCLNAFVSHLRGDNNSSFSACAFTAHSLKYSSFISRATAVYPRKDSRPFPLTIAIAPSAPRRNPRRPRAICSVSLQPRTFIFARYVWTWRISISIDHLFFRDRKACSSPGRIARTGDVDQFFFLPTPSDHGRFFLDGGPAIDQDFFGTSRPISEPSTLNPRFAANSSTIDAA